MERSSRVASTACKPKNLNFQKSLKLTKLSFVRTPWKYITLASLISVLTPTLVIDASMERSERVLQHWNPKLCIGFKKVWNRILTCGKELKSPKLCQYHSYIFNRYINGKVFTSNSNNMKTQIFLFFSKKFKIEFWFLFWLVLNS